MQVFATSQARLKKYQRADHFVLEMNMADHAEAYRQGKHTGYEPFALEGLQESIELVAMKRVKIIINGGSLNPSGLAKECLKLVRR